MKLSATDFLKNTITTAEHFGFLSLDNLKAHDTVQSAGSKLSHSASAQDRKLDNTYGLLTNGLSHFADAKLHAFEGPVTFYSVEKVPRTGETALALHVFGVPKSIAEALLIHTSQAMLRDLGETSYTVRINSLGDNDSAQRYNRELTNFLRKRIADLPTSSRELMKDHARLALIDLLAQEHELGHRSPNPLEYLSDPSRKHFREVIEYLDMSETPYEIDPRLMGHHQCFADAIFAIDLLDEESNRRTESPLSITGGRYSHFVSNFLKQDIPASGAVLILKDKKLPARTPKAVMPNERPVHLVHLGFAPKIRSLTIIDELRNKGILVAHDFTNESLSAQLRHAEEAGARYTIIVGQKEFVDGTVILRDMVGRTQENIPQDQLATRLKRSKMANV